MAGELRTYAVDRLARLVPLSGARAVKRLVRRARLHRAVVRAARLEPGRVPDRRLLRELRAGWGNRDWAAPLDYLEEVARQAAATRDPILECGSGLTTLLLGLVAARRGIEVWSLEHDPAWHARVARALDLPGMGTVHLHLAPLRDYGAFAWYEPPLAQMPSSFALVVCDGPPEGTRGGRYGLMPVIGERLAPGAVVLLDDAEREGERGVVRRWDVEGAATGSIRETESGTFAVLRRQ